MDYQITEEIKRRAKLFCHDNSFLPPEYIPAIEAAMNIGASIVLEKGVPPILSETEDGWKYVKKVFDAYYTERGVPPAYTGVVPPLVISRYPPRSNLANQALDPEHDN